MGAEITLVLGGARSGKSEVAERLALGLRTQITYVATGPAPEGDPEWADRVEHHRARRPADWTTVEIDGADLPGALRGVDGGALVDSLGTWVASFTDAAVGDDDVEDVCAALVERRDSGRPTILVSDEVGLGVHPSSRVGLLFRDALGNVNRAIGDTADRVLLVIAGRVLELDRPEDIDR